MSDEYHSVAQMDEQSRLYASMSRAVRNGEDTDLKSGPEFQLLEEAKDILDELQIMRAINVEQNVLLKTFQSILNSDQQNMPPSWHRDRPWLLRDKPKERAEVIEETVKKAESAREAILHLIDTKQRQANLYQPRSTKTLLEFNNQILNKTKNLTESNQEILNSTKETLQQSEKSGETLMVVSSLIDPGLACSHAQDFATKLLNFVDL